MCDIESENNILNILVHRLKYYHDSSYFGGETLEEIRYNKVSLVDDNKLFHLDSKNDVQLN